jgi:hypothetical protein
MIKIHKHKKGGKKPRSKDGNIGNVKIILEKSSKNIKEVVPHMYPNYSDVDNLSLGQPETLTKIEAGLEEGFNKDNLLHRQIYPILFFLGFLSDYFIINTGNLESILHGCWIVVPGAELYNYFLSWLNENPPPDSSIATGRLFSAKSSHGYKRDPQHWILSKDISSDHLNILGEIPIVNKRFNIQSCLGTKYQLLMGCQFGSNNVIKKPYTWFQMEGHETISIGHVQDFLQYKMSGKNIGPCSNECDLTESKFYNDKEEYELILKSNGNKIPNYNLEVSQRRDLGSDEKTEILQKIEEEDEENQVISAGSARRKRKKRRKQTRKKRRKQTRKKRRKQTRKKRRKQTRKKRRKQISRH